MRETRDKESETAFYSLWRVEEFPFLERTKSEAGLKINGIRKIHQLSLDSQGIRDKKLSCLNCGVSSLCLPCKQQKLKFTMDKIKNVLASAQEDNNKVGEPDESDEETPMEEVEGGEEADHSEQVDDEHVRDDQQDIGLGDIVWVLFNRRWTAAKIVALSDIPDAALSRQLRSNSNSTSLVKFYHDYSFHRAANTRIELLAQNLVDQSRARHHPAAYMEALSDLSYG